MAHWEQARGTDAEAAEAQALLAVLARELRTCEVCPSCSWLNDWLTEAEAGWVDSNKRSAGCWCSQGVALVWGIRADCVSLCWLPFITP
jgi:hypothetical protein